VVQLSVAAWFYNALLVEPFNGATGSFYKFDHAF